MNNFEQKLYDSLVHNSILFLDKGARELVQNDCNSLQDTIVLSCAHIQISLELAMRAYMIRVRGINAILDRKQQGLSMTEIETHYYDNSLKVVEFDCIKNQLKSCSLFNSEEFKIIDSFQMYRNKLVHFCCHIEENELEELSNKLIYYVVRIVLFLLYDNYEDKKPAEYFEKLLGGKFYESLWNNQGYIKALEYFAAQWSKKVGICPECERKTYSIDYEFCYLCNLNLKYSIGRANCDMCDGINTVISDNSMPGFCQKCGAKPEIFECPICKQTYELYADIEDWYCYDGHCTTKNIDYDNKSFG